MLEFVLVVSITIAGAVAIGVAVARGMTDHGEHYEAFKTGTGDTGAGLRSGPDRRTSRFYNHGSD